MTTDIIFLGIASRAVNVGFGTNLMGVSHTLLLPWFPQSLGAIRCLLGIRKSLAYSDSDELAFTPEFKDEIHPNSTATIDCRVDRSPGVSTVETEENTGATQRPYLIAQTAMDNTSFVLVPSAAPPIVVIEPTSIAVSALYKDRILRLGRFAVAFATPAPLSEEDRQAIMSNPVATKSTRLEFRCPLCSDRLAVYDRLKPDGKPIPRIDKSAVYLHDAPDEWT